MRPATSKIVMLILVAASFGIGQSFLPAQSVPFAISNDDASETATSFSHLLHKPAGKFGFTKVHDGHFYVGDQRLRIWGMNLCFGANFPRHKDAEKLAAHFAKIGVNGVRFHHMDGQDAPGGIWHTDENGQRTLDPEQIDRLDYFLNELHKNGIYANLNLHVSRTLTEAEGFPKLEKTTWWSASNKWVTYYDPDVQQKLKDYCRDFLTHENPYRGMRRTDDPGIALVELLNENYFTVMGTELLATLPQKYVDSFGVAWNQWLVKTHGSHDAMIKAWGTENSLGEAVVEATAWREGPGDWKVNAPDGMQTTFGVGGPDAKTNAVRFEAAAASQQAHHQQLGHSGLSVSADKYYTLSFWVRSDKPREFNFELSTSLGGEWRSLGMFETLKSDSEWRQYKRTFQPGETVDREAYVAASFGGDVIPIEFAKIELHEGVRVEPLPDDRRLEKHNIPVPGSSSSLGAHDDLKKFMVDTERSWMQKLKAYVRDDLGVKVPITASQENYHAPGLLAETMDFVDLHNYWHHPLFTSGKEWSPEHYTVGNQPIETDPLRVDWPARSLMVRTGWRYHGMPFTLSEWNHAEPSDVNTGAVMMAAVMGAMQDWDGVFFFTYEQSEDAWNDDFFEGFFDFNNQPVKQAVFAAASNIFLRGDLKPLPEKLSGTFEERPDGRLAFQYQLGTDPQATKAQRADIPDSLLFETKDKSLTWDATNKEHAFLKLNTPKSRGVWGLVAGQKFDVGKCRFEIGHVDRNYATLLATSQDNRPLEESNRVLLLASSGAENTGMKWNKERTSVGADWGTGPTTVNIVTAKISLPISGSNLKVYALDGRGNRTGEVPFVANGESVSFDIGIEYATIWYELVRGQ